MTRWLDIQEALMKAERGARTGFGTDISKRKGFNLLFPDEPDTFQSPRSAPRRSSPSKLEKGDLHMETRHLFWGNSRLFRSPTS